VGYTREGTFVPPGMGVSVGHQIQALIIPKWVLSWIRRIAARFDAKKRLKILFEPHNFYKQPWPQSQAG
jgi:hypothetical protein